MTRTYLGVSRKRNRWITYFPTPLWLIKFGICSLTVFSAAGFSPMPSMTSIKLGAYLLPHQKGRFCGVFPLQLFGLLWKERNQLSFEGNSSSSEDTFFRMRICTAHWVSTLPEFWGLQSNIILFN